MKVWQKKFSKETGWKAVREDGPSPSAANFVMVFGEGELISQEDFYPELKKQFPGAHILLNSTAGEIMDTAVEDHSVSLTAIHFENTALQTAKANVTRTGDSYRAGKSLAGSLAQEGLRYVLVLSDGQLVNGSDLVAGLNENLPAQVIVTGGLAGDGGKFRHTVVGLDERPVEGRVAAIGFYGESLTITHGSVGGWDSFGPERLITRSSGNVLYELDSKPALDIYKKYLGDYATELPQSGLLFPLSIRSNGNQNSLVRTILAVNEEEKSLTFAGNMPQGSYARLMKANLDRLIDGASTAAQHSLLKEFHPDFALLISCVGRKLVLNQRVEEEVEVVRAAYGEKTAIAGFYSYGEISPTFHFAKCELHNQTMTITTLTENPRV